MSINGCGDGGSGLEAPLIRVTTATTGSPLDPNGYLFTVDAGQSRSIGPNSEFVVTDVSPGDHAVLLSGLAGNCQVQGAELRHVTVAAGTTAAVDFNVTCAAPESGAIAVSTSTTGDDVDADGYVLLLDGSQRGQIGANAATLAGVATGDHVVELSNVAGNCRVDGDNPRTVSVVANSTAPAAFRIRCTGAGSSVAHWTSINPVVFRILQDVWGSAADDIYAVGFDKRSSAGTIIHYDGSIWSSQLDLREIALQSVWGAGANDVFAVGSHLTSATAAILHWDGTSWAEMTEPSLGTGSDKVVMWRSVWGSSGQDVFALGAAYKTSATPTTGLLNPTAVAVHYDGHAWTRVQLPASANRELLDAWGTSGHNLYFVGDYQPGDGNDEGVILHYDGSAWTETRYGTGGLHLKAIWGTGANDIFTVGDDGTILHFNGTSWNAQPTPVTKAVHEVWGSSSNDVIAVGARGIILHYDGSHWSRMESPTIQDLFGVWGSGPGNVFATGVLGVILHGTP